MIIKFFLFYAKLKTLKLCANKVLYSGLFDGR